MLLTPRGFDWEGIYNVLQAVITGLLGDPGCATAAATTVNVANTFAFRVNGRTATKATGTVALTGISTGAAQFRKVRLEIDVAGATSAVGGPIATAQNAAQMPRRSQNRCTIGWMEMPASFTGGVTNTNVAGSTIYSGDPDLSDGHVRDDADAVVTGLPPGVRGISESVIAR